ncbi:flagellar motor switch protein FliN [Nitrogeniibacter aestuarii]|uniref:flagellar motor switch protein FliN n=1 Tax=Nitrogeniibacter aestuarii TaxID=2815343 RepID=UPI001D12F2FC|nr:flagellar motor switch protein FliN [Nitrogeniibacter aestuarii]
MADTDTDENQVSDDDWASAMQEQADTEGGDSSAEDDWAAAMNEQAEAEQVAADLQAAADSADSPYQAKPASQLFPDFGAQGAAGGGSAELDMILDIPVQITVELGRTKLSIRNLLQLAHGSVVELDGLAGEPMDVLVNGTLIAQGEVVVVNEKFGIRLTDIITPAERMRKLRH